MIRETNVYEQFILDLITNVNFIRTKTAAACMCNYFPRISDTDAYIYIHSCQKLGYILTTEDGWCISKPHYHRMSENDTTISAIDKFRYNSIESINGLHISKSDMNIADCMMIVADMMPLSENYILSPSPWYISFVAKSESDPQGRLFQITTFRKGEEDAMGELLMTGYNFTDKEFRKQVRRIAILDDENKVKSVPSLGFTSLCVLDDEEPNGLRIVEKRKQETSWDDLR